MFGNVIMAILLTPVFLCFFMVLFELVGPLFEEWRAEQDRREKTALPAIGFCAFLLDMVSHDAEEAEAMKEAMEANLTEETGELMATARREMEEFEKYTLKSNFLFRQVRTLHHGCTTAVRHCCAALTVPVPVFAQPPSRPVRTMRG